MVYKPLIDAVQQLKEKTTSLTTESPMLLTSVTVLAERSVRTRRAV